MKFNAKVLGFSSAVSVIFWYAVSTLALMVAPTSVLQSILGMLPMNMASLIFVNAVIIFCAVFLIAFTTARLYNRFEK